MTRYTTSVIVLTVLVALGLTGPAFGIAATTQSSKSVPEAEMESVQDGSTTITPEDAIRAIRVAQDRTNGTAVGLLLEREGETGIRNGTLVYEVDVLRADGRHLQVDVNARQGTVLEVEAAESADNFFEDLFGGEGQLPEEPPDVRTLRSAVEAVGIATNQTESPEATDYRRVAEVELQSMDGRLVYVVELLNANGERHDVVVPASKGEGGVITTQPTEEEQD